MQTFTSPDAQSYLIKLIWVLLARESTDRERQLDNQLTDLRAEVVTIGGRIDREIPENAVSAFKRQRVALPDGTYGYRVVRPEWENILTALRRGECNALMVPDIDRAMRDPRTLEDLIDVVEYYGVYVASLTGNIDLTTDAGISAARSLVNQRNQESRNTSRRVINGQRHAAMKGGNHGGRMRPFVAIQPGWLGVRELGSGAGGGRGEGLVPDLLSAGPACRAAHGSPALMKCGLCPIRRLYPRLTRPDGCARG